MLRRSLLALGKYSKWQRSELRNLSPAEFAAYFEAAEDLIEDSRG